MEAGVIPPNCRRAILDMPANGPIVLHLELFPGEELNAPAILETVRDIGVKILEHE
jgi:hypothetical protein